MPRVIGIVSGKGGVGKTMLTANLALCLQDFNQEIVTIDADFTASNLGLQLGLYAFQPFNIQGVLKGDIRDIKKAIYIHPTGLRIVPSSIALDYLDIKAFRLKRVLNDLDGIVLVDSPAGLDREAMAVLKSCDDVLVITSPELPAVTDAAKVVHTAREMEKNVIGLVVNRVKRDKYELKENEIEAVTETPTISIIPEDKNIKKSLFEKIPIVRYRPYSSTALELRRLAAKIIEIDYKQPRFSRIKNLLRLKFPNNSLYKYGLSTLVSSKPNELL